MALGSGREADRAALAVAVPTLTNLNHQRLVFNWWAHSDSNPSQSFPSEIGRRFVFSS